MSYPIPSILAGPMLRHVEAHEINFWLVTSGPSRFRLQLFVKGESQPFFDGKLSELSHQQVQLGKTCFIHMLSVSLEETLPENTFIEYEIFINDEPETLAERLDGWCYGNAKRANFVRKTEVKNLLHGSCRKPHYPGGDGLCQADRVIESSRDKLEEVPALLMLSGDQVYVDDVAGPMLVAIHQLSKTLGLFGESFEGAVINSYDELMEDSEQFYKREQLLPQDEKNKDLVDQFFGGARKPIFTSAGAHNHLIALSEVIAMYLLCWSPECWRIINWEDEVNIPDNLQERYTKEKAILKAFAADLSRVRRAFAHIPVYMIFDDHDITDDWNLTRAWEEAAYQQAFSRRIIGNALVGYFLCQGWGNQPKNFSSLTEKLSDIFTENGIQDGDQFINELLAWGGWHYHLETQPPVVVLDTRTHRWRSESSPNKPSGLMDWESLSDLQQKLIRKDAVILVSPSPVFGVKLIEGIQRIFTFFGKSLLVDAENWMAHPGAANVMLNIFMHEKTPDNFLILSGDVHYSFVYDISLRGDKNSPNIYQITASGIKNNFPEKLLNWLDHLNQWFYNTRSPLNILTKRRKMLVKRRKPNGRGRRVLYNANGIGQVIIEGEYTKIRAKMLTPEEDVEFL